MRTITFRGFSPQLNKWVFGDLIHLEKNFKKYHAILDWSETGINVRVKRDSIGQFTGLKDKNGSDIYESDLLSLFNKDLTTKFLYVVKYEDAKFVLYHVKNNYGKWGDLHRAFDADFKDYGFSIVGNVFSNPELLTSEQTKEQ